MKRPWAHLPVGERMELLRSYRKAGYSYREAMYDFEDSLKKYEEGGQIVKEEPIKVEELKQEASKNINIQQEIPKFNNIVEKQNYWDAMIPKYGEAVKGRQVYMDLYNAPINIDKNTKNIYPPEALDTGYKIELPTELKQIKQDYINNYNAYVDLESYLKKFLPKTFNADNKAKLKEKLYQKMTEAYSNFMNNANNNITTEAINTTWKKVIDSKNNIKNKPLFVASLFDEGADKFTSRKSQDLSGFEYFGLDTAYERVLSLIEKGYLPKNFDKKLLPREKINEKRESILSADFTNLEDVVDMKNAIMNYNYDYVKQAAVNKKINLSPKALDYFAIVAYNAGEGNANKMLDKFNKDGLLENDKFLEISPDSYQQIHRNVIRRIKAAEMLKGEGIITESPEGTIRNKVSGQK
jgi:hypothetical protein